MSQHSIFLPTRPLPLIIHVMYAILYFISEKEPTTPGRAFVVTASKSAPNQQEKHSDKVAKGEIRLVLSSIEGNLGYKTLENQLPSLRDVDTSSKIWQDIKLSAKKASYVISDALGPYYKERNLIHCRQASGFSLSLDGATNKLGGLSKHLDLHLTFWHSGRGQVTHTLLSIIDLTSETADIMKTEIIKALDNEGLQLKKLFAIGRDNPNVNKSLMKMMTAEVQKVGGQIIDYGACILHTAHNGFGKGLKELSVDVDMLTKCIHGFFKKSTIRREAFADELLDIDEEPTNFRRHVTTRWLSMKPALVKIDKYFPAIEKYFLTSLPVLVAKGDTNAKEAKKTKYYELITTEIRKAKCRATIKQVIYVCDIFSPFMHEMQDDGPLIHRLYERCVYLLLSIVECIIKESKVPSDAKDLPTLSLTEHNLTVPKMSPSAKECYNKLSSSNQKTLREEFFKMFQTTGQYLQKEFQPFKSRLLRYLRVLDPLVQAEKSHSSGNNDVLNAAKLMGQFTTTEVDALSLQWDLINSVDVAYNKKGRIDIYYEKALNQLEMRHPNRNLHELKKFIQLTLSLPASNALVER